MQNGSGVNEPFRNKPSARSYRIVQAAGSSAAFVTASCHKWITHNASRAFAVVESVVRPEPQAILAVEPLPARAIPWIASAPESLS